MLKNLKIALLYGGISSEREISIKSGKAVEESFKRLGLNYRVFDPVEGKLFLEKLVDYSPDIAFIALHGKGGEDGTIQGVLDFLNIPYTGSTQKTSAITIDKDLTKKILSIENLPVPKGKVLFRENFEEDMIEDIKLPVVVKPATEGSSIGVFIVNSASELKDAVKNAFKLDSKVIVEEFIKGRELTVGILNGQPLEIVEIIVEEGFYDYKNKYFSDKTKYICPAYLEKDLYREIQNIAKKSCEILNVEGAARVDFILSDDGIPHILEINTIPGLTDHSLLPKSAAAAGLSFDDLIENILLGALYGKKEKDKIKK